jgi:acetyl esterase/lipase
MAGVSGGAPSDLDDPRLGNADVSSRVQAVVSWYGPTDFTVMDAQTQQTPACGGRSGGHDDAGSPESRWLGTPVRSATDLVKASNPIAWLPSQPAGTVPPFLLAHGGADCTVPPGQSTVLGRALNSSGVPAEVRIVDGAGHAEGGLDEGLLTPTLDFISTALGRPATSPVTSVVSSPVAPPATSAAAAEPTQR